MSELAQVRLLIAVPGKHWEADFGISLAMLANDLTSAPLAGVGSHAFSICNIKGSILPQVREELLEQAIMSKSTHVLFLDTDHTFPRQLARVLISRRCDVIGVNCVTKTLPVVPTARQFSLEKREGIPIPIEENPSAAVSEVWRVGMGVMLIKIDALKDLRKPFFGTRWDEQTDHHVGEDWFFCEKLQKAGITIHIDNQLSPLVTHIGSLQYNWTMTEESNVKG